MTSVTDQREAERKRIDPDFSDARNQVGAEGDQRAQRPLGQQQSDGAAKHREEHAFGDELAHHVAAARAEREARRDLSSSSGKAREQQVGDVRARDQEHARHGAEEQQITLSLRADRIVQERHDLDRRRRVDVGRVRRAVAGGDRRSSPRAPASSDTPGRSRAIGLEKEAAAVQLRRREKRHFAGPRDPDLLVIQRERGCGLGQDADDRVGRAVERERLAEHRRIAVEALLPHLLADQHHVLAAGAIFIRREVAADHRLQSQRRQQRGRGLQANQLFRIAAAGQRERVA